MAEAAGIHEGVALRAPDTPLIGDDAAKVRKIAELQAGMRCVGCGERVTIGIRFTQFKPVLREGRPFVERHSVTACSRKDCSYASETAPLADVMEMVEFAWLDEQAPREGQPEGSARVEAVARAKASPRASRSERRARAAAAR